MVEKSHNAGFWPQLYDPFRSLGAKVADWFSPASDASTGEDAYRISMELPGVAESDIELSVADGVVTVKGEKKSEREEKGDTWFFSERQYGAFQRSFRLPADADEGAVAADLRDGVLTITAPRRTETPEKSRRIEVRKSV